MDDDNTLTADELKFFQTGELPPELIPPPVAAEPAVAEPPTAEPPPAAAPTTAPAPDYQQALAAANQRYAAVEQQLTTLTQQLNNLNQQPATVEPDPATDPVGAITHKLNALQAELGAIKQQSLQTTQQQTFTAFVDNIKSLRTEFATTTPDFDDAYKHLRTIRTDDLRSLGISEADIPQALLNEEISLAQSALKQGQNPAKLIYDLAKRHGFSAKPAVPVVAPPIAPASKIAALKAGAEAAKTAPRAAADPNLTLDSLRDAGNDDLDKLVSDDDQWYKLVGGRPLGRSIF